MLHHVFNKEKSEAAYLCKFRKHPTFTCKAKATVVRTEDGGWTLVTPDDQIRHSCEPNESGVVASLLREQMKDIVRNDPAKPVSQAIKSVRIEAAKTHGNHEEFYEQIISELGNDKALEDMLYAVRI